MRRMLFIRMCCNLFRLLVFCQTRRTTDSQLPHIYDTDDLGFAAEMMGKYHLQKLLVLKEGDGREIAGIIQAESILKLL